MKHVFATCFCVSFSVLACVLFAVCSVNAPAVQASDLFTYTVTDGNVTITGYVGDETDVVIPEQIDGCPVTAIGAKAFFWRTDLTSISLPDTLTVIGESALDGCTGLKTLTVPQNVTSIGSYAFANCSGLTELNYNVTAELSFGSDKFAASRQVFGGIGANTDGVRVTFGEGVTRIPAYMFCPIVGETYNVKAVETKGVSLKAIGRNAFFHCYSLTNFCGDGIVIPDTVEVIEEAAFDTCTGVTRIVIPASVTQIDTLAFTLCKNVTELYFDAYRISSFGADKYAASRQVFASIGLDTDGTTVFFGKQITKIPDYMFYPTYGETYNVKTVAIEGALKEIGRNAFFHCYSLTSFGKEHTIAVPDTVETIREAAFDTCTGVTRIELPASLTEIELLAFTQCKNVTELYYNVSAPLVFGGDKYAARRWIFLNLGADTEGVTVIFGDCVTQIPDNLFTSISGESYHVKKVILHGNKLTRIGLNSFAACKTLDSALYCGSSEQFEQNVTVDSGNDYLLAALGYHLAHTFDDMQTVTAPTCTEGGVSHAVCTGCLLTEIVQTPALGHAFADETCTRCGLYAPYGDADGNGAINGKDIVRLLRYLAEYNPTSGRSETVIANGDANGDGVINGRDATRLLRYLANIDPFTGKSEITLGKAS